MKLLFIHASDDGAYSRLHKLDDELSYVGTAGVVKDDATKSPQVFFFGNFCVAVYRDGDVGSVRRVVENYQFTITRTMTASSSQPQEEQMTSQQTEQPTVGDYVTATVAPGWEREGMPMQGVFYSDNSEDQAGTVVVRCLSGDFVCLRKGMTSISVEDLPTELRDHQVEVVSQIRRHQRGK